MVKSRTNKGNSQQKNQPRWPLVRLWDRHRGCASCAPAGEGCQMDRRTEWDDWREVSRESVMQRMDRDTATETEVKPGLKERGAGCPWGRVQVSRKNSGQCRSWKTSRFSESVTPPSRRWTPERRRQRKPRVGRGRGSPRRSGQRWQLLEFSQKPCKPTVQCSGIFNMLRDKYPEPHKNIFQK